MVNIVIFCILAVVVLASAIMCVTTTRIMRAATFLLFVLFGVAGIYFLLDYTFLGAAQISIYAGGVTMLYIFAIQLVNKRTLQGLQEKLKKSNLIAGLLTSIVGFALVVFVLFKNNVFHKMTTMEGGEVPMSQVGTLLMGSDKYQYVLPFEFISLFLLACIIGGIMIARKEEQK